MLRSAASDLKHATANRAGRLSPLPVARVYHDYAHDAHEDDQHERKTDGEQERVGGGHVSNSPTPSQFGVTTLLTLAIVWCTTP